MFESATEQTEFATEQTEFVCSTGCSCSSMKFLEISAAVTFSVAAATHNGNGKFISF